MILYVFSSCSENCSLIPFFLHKIFRLLAKKVMSSGWNLIPSISKIVEQLVNLLGNWEWMMQCQISLFVMLMTMFGISGILNLFWLSNSNIFTFAIWLWWPILFPFPLILCCLLIGNFLFPLPHLKCFPLCVFVSVWFATVENAN